MRVIIIALFVFVVQLVEAQDTTSRTNRIFKHIVDRKGKLTLYWGWNREAFTKSNINFKGDGYNFTLYQVHAHDRQTSFEPVFYVNPSTMTIPQYQYRIGYYFTDKYSISWGFNHMKYVMQSGQTVKITGEIDTPEAGVYNGSYSGDDIVLSKDFLRFEHTDGLNYLSFNLDRTETFLESKNKKQNVSFIGGLGAGMIIPRSNVTLWGKRSDEWHLAGYGVSSHVAIRIDFLSNFFVQGQLEGGFINMTDVITTGLPGASAKHSFFFLERMIQFGGYYQLKNRQKKSKIG